MVMARLSGPSVAILLSAFAAAGCVTDDVLQADGQDDLNRAVVQSVTSDLSAVDQLTALAESAPVTRSEEAGVTVIRGTMPPQLIAMASTAPVQNLEQITTARRDDTTSGQATGGSLVAAALTGGDVATQPAAPGALATAGQLAALASSEQHDSLPSGVVDMDMLAPAAGPASTTTVISDTSVLPVAGGTIPVAATPPVDPIVAEVQRLASTEPASIEQLEARGAVRMSTEEIIALSVGNTLTHTNAASGFSVNTYYDPNGTSQLINDGRGLPSRYQISDGARCRIDSQGLGVCAMLYRDGDTTWVCDQRDQGMCNWVVTRVRSGFVAG